MLGDTDPLLVTIGVFAIVMSILAAKDLKKNLFRLTGQVKTCSLFLLGMCWAPQTIPTTWDCVRYSILIIIIGLEILYFRAAYRKQSTTPCALPQVLQDGLTQGKEADRRKVFSPSPTQNKLELKSARLSLDDPPRLFNVNVSHANQGVLPSHGFLRKYAVAASPVELSLNDTNEIQARNSVFDEADLVNLETDYRESYT